MVFNCIKSSGCRLYILCIFVIIISIGQMWAAPEESDLEEIHPKNTTNRGLSPIQNIDFFDVNEPAVIYTNIQEESQSQLQSLQLIDAFQLAQIDYYYYPYPSQHTHLPAPSIENILPEKQFSIPMPEKIQSMQQQSNGMHTTQLQQQHNNAFQQTLNSTINNMPLRQSTPGFRGTLPAPLHSPLGQMLANSSSQYSMGYLQQSLIEPYSNSNNTNNINMSNMIYDIYDNANFMLISDSTGTINTKNNTASDIINNKLDIKQNNESQIDGSGGFIASLINDNSNINNMRQIYSIPLQEYRFEDSSSNSSQLFSTPLLEENKFEDDDYNASQGVSIIQTPISDLDASMFDIYFGWSSLDLVIDEDFEVPQIEQTNQQLQQQQQQAFQQYLQNGGGEQLQVQWPRQSPRQVQFPPHIARLFGIPVDDSEELFLEPEQHVGVQDLLSSGYQDDDKDKDDSERVQIKFNAEIVIERGSAEDFVTLDQGCMDYFTNGPSQLAVDEGLKLQAPNGDKYIIVSNAQQCAAACEVMVQRCGNDCCDSFAYNKRKMECFLKKGGSRFTSSFNQQGWQTFWRSYNGSSIEQAASIHALSVCGSDLQVGQYSNAYISRGYGQLAVIEGSNLRMKDGSKFKLNISIQNCALECEQLSECLSFSYNIERKDCYLKSGGQRFDTRISDEGWATYWKADDSVANVNCKKPGWFCLYCKGDYGNSCRNY